MFSRIPANIKFFITGLLNSYSQVFFAKNLSFAVLLIIITFIDVIAGISGLVSVLVTMITGHLLGIDKYKISEGIYGFNSLLVGLGLGYYFDASLQLLFILVLAAIFTLFISISLEGIIGKYTLPYLSIPFIISLWTLSLATSDLEALGISQRGIYNLNDLYLLGGNRLVQLYEWWNNINLPESLRVYFISLGAIFFQFNVLSGILISFGLLCYSRIGFSLSLIGFYTAFLFYHIIGANLTDLNYSYIGFNYILTAIAVGGFFIVPSRLSYLWIVVLIPIVALLTISLNAIFFNYFQLPIYSLPFNIIVLLFLYVLKFRTRQSQYLREVFIQQYSPEKNLYSYQNDIMRFRHRLKVPFRLPFWGEWTISQGHDGEHTHKADWKYAWDFVIQDEDGKQFKNSGDNCEDYYCFEKEVLSPADGIVEEVVDNVNDNQIGDVNLTYNWGNTIIIKHKDMLYSKLCHLKNGSIQVEKNSKIKQGEIIARVGNSGRSPYPHLHFQFQATPFVGSVTLDYPFSYYILSSGKDFEFHSFDYPALNDCVSNINISEILQRALNFIPGKKLKFHVNSRGKEETVNWEVHTNEYNNSYIKCNKTNSLAYYESDGNLLYFKHFEGKKSSLLYYFFLGVYKVQMGFYQDLQLEDKYPVHLLFGGMNRFIHDFFAPFFTYLKAKFSITYESIDNPLFPEKVILSSTASKFCFTKKTDETNFRLQINNSGIEQFAVQSRRMKTEAQCIKED